MAPLKTCLLTAALLTPTRAVFPGESDHFLRNTRSDSGVELLAHNIHSLLDGDNQVQDLATREAGLANILAQADQGAVEELLLRGLYSRNRASAAEKHKSKEETIKAASKHRPRSLFLRDRKSKAEARLKKFQKPTGSLKPQLATQKKKSKEEAIKAASKKH
ncbi:unnamed protein product [Clonostachys solani]|uniref:Uncharacterized protein n=1 Tax=Clonostachys solani TaxID=160281 RepID=A0A9N9Z2C0_9HYPO|nr:unnamed protein product [Clonostachys solani]